MQQNQIKLDLKSVEDFSNTFISPIICFISIISNLLNINIFNRLRKTDRFYQYLYYKSTVNCTYLLICLLSFTFKLNMQWFIFPIFNKKNKPDVNLQYLGNTISIYWIRNFVICCAKLFHSLDSNFSSWKNGTNSIS